MAVKKRTTKKKTARKSASPRSRAKRQSPGKLKQLLFVVALCLFVTALLLGVVYYFGSFETRTRINHQAIRALNTVRTPPWLPGPISTAFDHLYDKIPGSEGLIVESGELGRDESPMLAGIPHSRSPIRVLHNKSHINLYDEKERQARCIAFRVSDEPRQNAKISGDLFEDPRVRPVHASDMSLDNWIPAPIAPPQALAKEFGSVGANEAKLSTNHAPMPKAFAQGIWKETMELVAERYPKRFGELWIYTGPAYRKEHSKLSSGILIPDSFYVIVFDLTDSGALRALSLLIPTNVTKGADLSKYITSISQIEFATGLQFLPDIGFDSRELLDTFVSPYLW